MKPSSSIARVCRLCLQPKPLCRSHIIPEFMHDGLYDENGQMTAYIDEFNGIRRRTVQIGHRENLFCAGCEDHINRKYEQPNIGFWRALIHGEPLPPGVSMVPVAGAPALFVSGFDYAAVKLLFLSIFWRASVASRQNYLVDFGQHEDTVRLMLLERNPLASTTYPCLIYRVTGGAAARKHLRRPVGTTKDGWPSYQLLLPGAVLWSLVSANAAVYPQAPKEDGSMHLVEIPAEDTPIVQQTIETVRAANRQRGAIWVRQRFTKCLKEQDATDRHHGWHLTSPEDAGGECFDRDFWVLTIKTGSGQMHRVTIPSEEMEDLEASAGIRDRIGQQLTALAAKAHSSGRPPIKKRDPQSGA